MGVPNISMTSSKSSSLKYLVLAKSLRLKRNSNITPNIWSLHFGPIPEQVEEASKRLHSKGFRVMFPSGICTWGNYMNDSQTEGLIRLRSQCVFCCVDVIKELISWMNWSDWEIIQIEEEFKGLLPAERYIFRPRCKLLLFHHKTFSHQPRK